LSKKSKIKINKEFILDSWIIKFEFELTISYCCHACRNFDNNNFNGTVNLLQWRKSYFLQETEITVSIVNNDISELEPSWEDETYPSTPYLASGNCAIL
jgi:hypothetical protein